MVTPEVVHIAISFDDGTVGIMLFVCRTFTASGAVASMRPLTRENVEAEIARSSFGSDKRVTGWRFTDPTEIPRDRTYRAAWVDDGKAIVHDLPRAKDVHRKRIRRLRGGALAELDGQWMRAFGKKDAASAEQIEAKRQRWRDAPADLRIETASSIEDLKAIELPEV